MQAMISTCHYWTSGTHFQRNGQLDPQHSIFSHAEAELYYPWLASCCSPNQITRKKTETSLLLQHVGAKALEQLRGSQKGSQNGSKVDQKVDVFCYKVHTEDGQLYHSNHPPLDKIS